MRLQKILIEVALLKSIEATRAVSLDAVLNQLQQLRAEGGGSLPAIAPANIAAPRASVISETAPTSYTAQKTVAAPAATPTPTPAAPAPLSVSIAAPIEPKPAGGAVDLNVLWPQLLEAVGRASQFTRSYLIEAHPISFIKETLAIGFDPEFADHLSLVDNPKNHALIQTKLREMGHAHPTVKFVKSERPIGFNTPPTATAPAPIAATEPTLKPAFAEPPKKKAFAPVNMDEFKNDPFIQQALEIFKGQIVDVRK